MRRRTALGPQPRELCTSQEREAAQCTTLWETNAKHMTLKAFKEFSPDPLSKVPFGPLDQDLESTSFHAEKAKPPKAPFMCS